jgi:flagellar hook protein FlgE
VTFTDNGLDLAVSGQGFFVLDDNGGRLYTRAGAFGLDRDGYVINSEGQRLVAFQANSTGTVTGATAPLQLTTFSIPPQSSGSMIARLNLDASSVVPTNAFAPTDPASYNSSTSTTLYDSLGNSHLATLYYRRVAGNDWQTYAYVDGVAVDGPDTLSFDTSGALTAPVGGVITSSSFTPAGGGAPMTVAIDYAGTTQFGAPFAVNALNQDGYTTGQLTGLDVDATGIIFARFSNGQALVLGQVALANFANVQGLKPVGDTNWTETYGSGAALLGAPGTSSLGLVQAGALEESNVDLAEELVKMIIAQRNFQANAEVITTADTVTQSIINIR